jgi:probable rRNA maturation factor
MPSADDDGIPRAAPLAGARRRLHVDVVDGRGRPAPARGLARWLQRTAPARAAGRVTVALVSDRTMRTLNRAYRGADYATDVLSFGAGPAPPSPRGRGRAPRRTRRALPERFLGDVVIATGVAARQARACRHAVSNELKVLALHGLLHLLGYDHERDGGRMEAVERRLRRRGGLSGGLIERVRAG